MKLRCALCCGSIGSVGDGRNPELPVIAVDVGQGARLSTSLVQALQPPRAPGRRAWPWGTGSSRPVPSWRSRDCGVVLSDGGYAVVHAHGVAPAAVRAPGLDVRCVRSDDIAQSVVASAIDQVAVTFAPCSLE